MTGAGSKGISTTCASMPATHNNVCVPGVRLPGPVQPCPNQNNVRVPRANGWQCIHAQTIMASIFQEHTFTSASMPHHDNFRVPRALDGQSPSAQAKGLCALMIAAFFVGVYLIQEVASVFLSEFA